MTMQERPRCLTMTTPSDSVDAVSGTGFIYTPAMFVTRFLLVPPAHCSPFFDALLRRYCIGKEGRA